MRSSNIQMELLSETRSPQQALNYAVNRERGLANQQEILRSNNTNWNTVSYVRTNRQRTHNQNSQQKQNPCWKCGGTFSLAHLQTCPAKSTTCKICKKPGHYTSLCTAKMPERRPQNIPQSSSTQNYKQPQTRRIRNINQEETESEQLEESVDAEAALYIKELHEDWQNINIIRPTQFSPQKNNFINKESNGEFWVETTTQSHKLQWLADTGSPRSFVNQEFAQKLQKEIQNIRIENFTENTIYKCFNNNNIEIEGVLIIDIQSGSWTAKSCKVLIVKNKTNNIMGRDLLSKLEITLNASKNTDKKLLRHDALTQEELWRRDGSSENELDIQYNTQSTSPTPLDSDDSENQPLIYKSPKEAKQNAMNNTSGPMSNLPTANDSQDIPGLSRIQSRPVTSAPKRTRSDLEASNKPKKRTCKKEPIKTKWSKEKVIKLATKNQREQQQPKRKNKPKNKQSTPLHSFNEKAKQAALKHSMAASTRRLPSSNSDTDTNRSFLIFNTPIPQPPSIQIYNVDTDIPGTPPFEIITSNDPTDFMETSKMSPKIQSPQLTASTSLDTNSMRDDNQDIDFNKSTKKLDKIVKKINTINAEKEEKEQIETTNSSEPIVIYLDTSNSPNGTDQIHSPQSEQAPNGEMTSAQTKQPDMVNKNEPSRPPQAEIQKSPASSLIYKTPPSSPPPDTISDLDEDDIKALNEIQ